MYNPWILAACAREHRADLLAEAERWRLARDAQQQRRAEADTATPAHGWAWWSRLRRTVSARRRFSAVGQPAQHRLAGAQPVAVSGVGVHDRRAIDAVVDPLPAAATTSAALHRATDCHCGIAGRCTIDPTP